MAVKENNPVILKRLTEMAERLGLSSNQALLIYAGNNFWLNAQWADAAVGILRNLAQERGIELYDYEEPFIVTLAKKGVFTEDEQRLFGWKPKVQPQEPAAQPAAKPTGKRRARTGN